MLCADDFAISPGTSRVIAELARNKCINGISCMAASENWHDDAKLLAGIETVECGALGPVQVGLHLVLASEAPIGSMYCTDAEGRLPSADQLLLMALTGSIERQEFAAEIDRQFAAFKAARGSPPDFVDAHQHVHVYPIIRKLVVAATKRHAPNAWIRVPSDRLSAMIKRPFFGKALGSAIHSLGFRALLAKYDVPANGSFAGHYDFGAGYATHLPKFFGQASSSHLVMCHPGSNDLRSDAIGQARAIEAEVIGQMPLEFRLARALRPGLISYVEQSADERA